MQLPGCVENMQSNWIDLKTNCYFLIAITIFSELKNPEETLKSMIKYKSLPQHIEAVFIHNTLKLFANVTEKYELEAQYDKIITLCDLIMNKLNESVKSGELEVQERSSTTLMVLEILKEAFLQSELVL